MTQAEWAVAKILMCDRSDDEEKATNLADLIDKARFNGKMDGIALASSALKRKLNSPELADQLWALTFAEVQGK